MSVHFRFRAIKASTGEAVKVDVWLAGVNRGFTPTGKDEYLSATIETSGTYEWYAKKDGQKVDSGSSRGGTITIYVD